MARLTTVLAFPLAYLLTTASGHVTFKLPATPGIPAVALYPNTAPSGGYGARAQLASPFFMCTPPSRVHAGAIHVCVLDAAALTVVVVWGR